MHQLVAYLRSRPKTTIAILVALVLVAAALWKYEAGTSSRSAGLSVAPSMPTDAYYGGGGVASGNADKGYAPEMGMPSPMPDRAVMPPYTQSAGPTAAEVDQKIIKNGYLQMRVEKVADASAEIGRIASAKGGFIQNSSVTERGDGTYSGETTVRVPVQKFEEAMAEIKKLATLVKNETSTGQDVTEQYTDLQAQLRNAQAQEETYLVILKQARNVEEILLVQDRLGNIRAVIESLQGRIKYLENSTSYSTISVSLEEEPAVRAPTKAFRLGAIVRDAVQTLVNAVEALIAGLIYLVIVWGAILAPIALIGWLVWRKWGRRPKRR